MLLQLSEIIKRFNAIEFTGMDQAHEQVSHASPVEGLIEVGVFAMQNRFFRARSQILLSKGAPGCRRARAVNSVLMCQFDRR